MAHPHRLGSRRAARALGAGTLLGLALALSTGPAAAAGADLLAPLESAARDADSGFSGFSAARGQAFFDTTHGGKWSCSSCHTGNPLQAGRHAATGRTIKPLAPAANPERLSDAAKVDKWFRRNCMDVLKRECSPAEKGDVITYLLSLQ
jgi:mono/diheme cytochrome c family protein